MYNIRVYYTAIVFLLFFSFIQVIKTPVYAVSVTITNYPSIITDEPFTVTASVSGATTGTNYLRLDMFKDQTINYFGETFNGSDWYGGSTYSQYLSITIQSGITWGGTIQGRIGSPTSTEYDGNGIYKMRVRRYTSGGGYTSSEANNSAVVVSISLPTPTPTPTFTPTPIPTNTPTPAKTPTPTNIPTPTKINTPTPIPTKTQVATNLNEESPSAGEAGVVLSEKIATQTPTPTPEVLTAGFMETNLAKILIILGGLFLASCGVVFMRWRKEISN